MPRIVNPTGEKINSFNLLQWAVPSGVSPLPLISKNIPNPGVTLHHSTNDQWHSSADGHGAPPARTSRKPPCPIFNHNLSHQPAEPPRSALICPTGIWWTPEWRWASGSPGWVPGASKEQTSRSVNNGYYWAQTSKDDAQHQDFRFLSCQKWFCKRQHPLRSRFFYPKW